MSVEVNQLGNGCEFGRQREAVHSTAVDDPDEFVCSSLSDSQCVLPYPMD